MTQQTPEDLGLGLAPGSEHYRAFIGPAQDYDLVAAMTFGLMTTLGLRQHHSLLDVGCGSLRNGRLFIPYLNSGKYTGIEPNEWLVQEGVEREVGMDLVRLKNPRFVRGESPAALGAGCAFDFAVAQSIFSHCGADLMEDWLQGVSACLTPTGAFVATFLPGTDFTGSGWVYPECVSFSLETVAGMAVRAGLRFRLLDWLHPRQHWALFAAPGFDDSWIEQQGLSWNGSLASGIWNAEPETDEFGNVGVRYVSGPTTGA